MSDAFISPGPLASNTSFFVPSAAHFNARDLTFNTISVTSSLIPLIDVNSCRTPSICIEVTAAPLMEDNNILHFQIRKSRNPINPETLLN